MSRRVESAAGRARRVLSHIAGGRLANLPVTVRFWDGSELAAPEGAAPAGVLHVGHDAAGYLLREPNQLGLARAYVSGALELDGDLETLLALRHQLQDSPSVTLAQRALVLAEAIAAVGPSAARGAVPQSEFRGRGRVHSMARDRQAVRHHYDVSNAFYRRLLGPSLVYSCAYFATPDDDLETAQNRKLELICHKLRLQPEDRLLDLGCGWGSLVIHAAKYHGVRAVGVTLSEAQAAVARARVRDAGLADLCEIRVADYREVDDGPYDKIASIGMYEHVGAAQMDAYACTVARLLRPGGLALNHGISRLYSQRPGKPGFIDRFVFPDGELPPLADVVAALQRAGLEPRDVESLREHYPLTLRCWLRNLAEHGSEAAAEIGAERVRIWRLYLTASAVGFEDADISVNQVLVARVGASHGLPLRRPTFRAETPALRREGN